MPEKRPTSGKQPAAEQNTAAEQLSLDHGVQSLVAQDNPDDSQLGAPGPVGKNRSPRESREGFTDSDSR